MADYRYQLGTLSNPQTSAEFTRIYYNDEPGAPIRIGQIPEPNSLALLALGAAGVLTQRRRR